ncbi:MAG: hypothetical protein KGZ58_01585 [Ignavibacteriales bacterium]|nr:hypothetical protein [Ignavibacteriales bacterium]
MSQFKNYPGRIIIIGKTKDENIFALYAITGRSSSSRARKLILVEKEKTIFVVPTNESEIEKGNRELLIYPSMWFGNGIVVSNGKQTSSIINTVMLSAAQRSRNTKEVLENGLSEWTYEPDAPHYTPRISACNSNDGKECVMSILKRNENGNEERNFFALDLEKSKMKYVSTYNGENTNPLPSFIGEPKEIILQSSSPKELCEEVFQMLNEEFRVATACVMMNRNTNLIETFILNNKN